MDYEKKYKEALEKARQLCAYPTTKPFISDLQDLFPELKESEDERIRKELIDWFSDTHAADDFRGIAWERIVAWLEKQGEQKSVDDLTPQEAMDIAVAKCFEEGEQNPAWSEEDETTKSNISHIIRQYDKISKRENKPCWYIGDCLLWMQNIKDRVQPKQEWSEEDKRKLDKIYSILGQAADTHAFSTTCRLIGDKECVELQDFLKSLKDRVLSQPKQEWNEQEQVRINRIVSCLENLNVADNDILLKDVDWLKSLKERYTWKPSGKLDEASYQVGIKRVLETPESYGLTKYNWKPSEGQLECLGYAIAKAEKDWSPLATNRIYLTLKALKEQLLELRGSKV